MHRQLGSQPDGRGLSTPLRWRPIQRLQRRHRIEGHEPIHRAGNESLREYLGRELFAYLITVCADAEARCPSVWPGVQHRLHWQFDDPAAFEGTEEEKLAKFREVRDQIKAAVEAFVAQERAKYAARATPRQ